MARDLIEHAARVGTGSRQKTRQTKSWGPGVASIKAGSLWAMHEAIAHLKSIAVASIMH